MDQRDATNRDLLFGLLALQNGLVEQDVLILAFRAWTRDKSRPIAEILAAQGRDRRRRTGPARGACRQAPPSPRGRSREEPGGREHGPFHSATTSRRSATRMIEATLGHVGGGSGATEQDDLEQTGSYASGAAASDGQRFRILRPHARGGLGAVFVALDAELNREVALKQILDRHADDPASRTRFVLEAEITGGLEHPGHRAGLRTGELRRRPAVLRHAVRAGRQPQGDDRRVPRRRDAQERPRPPVAGRCGSCCGGSSTSATRSTTPTPAASCTATSNRPT